MGINELITEAIWLKTRKAIVLFKMLEKYIKFNDRVEGFVIRSIQINQVGVRTHGKPLFPYAFLHFFWQFRLIGHKKSIQTHTLTKAFSVDVKEKCHCFQA